jgi:hypothetical protein
MQGGLFAFHNFLVNQNIFHRGRWLGAFLHPINDLFFVNLYFLADPVYKTDFLAKLSRGRRKAFVGHDNPKRRLISLADPMQSYS